MTGARVLAGLALLLALAGAARAQEAPAWSVDTDASTVGFIARQNGRPVDGVFESFTAGIRFAPEALETSRVEVAIEVASVSSGSSERDDTIRSKSLFHVEQWPAARFEAERFEASADGGYVAHGRLTLRDVTREVALPFDLMIEPDPEAPERLRAHAKGELTVMRLDYGVGQGLWEDTSVVADEVVIRIDIFATRPAP